MSAASQSTRTLSWAAVRALLAVRYPSVPTVLPTILADWLASPDPPLMLDVRTEAEFAVSHLAGARRIEPGAPIPSDLLALDRAGPIVAYCSVGVRSAGFVQQLRDAGFTDVRNLGGGIFRWVNERRPVVRGKHRVAEVHPYNARWGVLLTIDPHHQGANV